MSYSWTLSTHWRPGQPWTHALNNSGILRWCFRAIIDPTKFPLTYVDTLDGGESLAILYIVVVRGIYKGGDNEKWTVALSAGQPKVIGFNNANKLFYINGMFKLVSRTYSCALHNNDEQTYPFEWREYMFSSWKDKCMFKLTTCWVMTESELHELTAAYGL